jgi:RNA polymerase primary sigma factor
LEQDGELTSDKLRAALDRLSLEERQVIELRFGLSDGRARTLEETGRKLNLTREQVRKIESAGLKKLPTTLLD